MLNLSQVVLRAGWAPADLSDPDRRRKQVWKMAGWTGEKIIFELWSDGHPKHCGTGSSELAKMANYS